MSYFAKAILKFVSFIFSGSWHYITIHPIFWQYKIVHCWTNTVIARYPQSQMLSGYWLCFLISVLAPARVKPYPSFCFLTTCRKLNLQNTSITIVYYCLIIIILVFSNHEAMENTLRWSPLPNLILYIDRVGVNKLHKLKKTFHHVFTIR